MYHQLYKLNQHSHFNDADFIGAPAFQFLHEYFSNFFGYMSPYYLDLILVFSTYSVTMVIQYLLQAASLR